MPSAKPHRAAIYARTNKDPRTVFECRRMHEQIERCLSVAESHGLSIDDVHIYKDEGMSGAASITPDLDRLLSAVADYRSVYVQDLRRISRNSNSAATAINHILDSGAAIWCCDQVQEITAAKRLHELQLFDRMYTYVSEFERKQRSTAAKRGHANRRKAKLASLSTQCVNEPHHLQGDTNDIQEK